jgi:hypothetical protein
MNLPEQSNMAEVFLGQIQEKLDREQTRIAKINSATMLLQKIRTELPTGECSLRPRLSLLVCADLGSLTEQAHRNDAIIARIDTQSLPQLGDHKMRITDQLKEWEDQMSQVESIRKLVVERGFAPAVLEKACQLAFPVDYEAFIAGLNTAVAPITPVEPMQQEEPVVSETIESVDGKRFTAEELSVLAVMVLAVDGMNIEYGDHKKSKFIVPGDIKQICTQLQEYFFNKYPEPTAEERPTLENQCTQMRQEALEKLAVVLEADAEGLQILCEQDDDVQVLLSWLEEKNRIEMPGLVRSMLDNPVMKEQIKIQFGNTVMSVQKTWQVRQTSNLVEEVVALAEMPVSTVMAEPVVTVQASTDVSNEVTEEADLTEEDEPVTNIHPDVQSTAQAFHKKDEDKKIRPVGIEGRFPTLRNSIEEFAKLTARLQEEQRVSFPITGSGAVCKFFPVNARLMSSLLKNRYVNPELNDHNVPVYREKDVFMALFVGNIRGGIKSQLTKQIEEFFVREWASLKRAKVVESTQITSVSA